MNRGARNSVAAQDWALKRKQQMERAARIKSERATVPPSQRGEEGDEGDGGGRWAKLGVSPGKLTARRRRAHAAQQLAADLGYAPRQTTGSCNHQRSA